MAWKVVSKKSYKFIVAFPCSSKYSEYASTQIPRSVLISNSTLPTPLKLLFSTSRSLVFTFLPSFIPHCSPPYPLLGPTGQACSLECPPLLWTHLQSLKSTFSRRQQSLWSVPSAPTLPSAWPSSTPPHLIGVCFSGQRIPEGQELCHFPHCIPGTRSSTFPSGDPKRMVPE